MIKDKSIVAIIPARGGSKRLPGKNVLPLNGKPLIAWTIEAAKASKYIDRVVISTDDHGISETAKSLGAEIPFMRPAHLASDTANSNDVILHTIHALDKAYDIVILLQPTSPFRTSRDVDDSIESLVNKEADGIISVTPCEHSPLWANVLPIGGSMEGFLSKKANKRSQDLDTYFRLNGAIYTFTSDSILLNQGISYSKNVYSYVMPQERSIDIDTFLDFEFAQFIASKL